MRCEYSVGLFWVLGCLLCLDTQKLKYMISVYGKWNKEHPKQATCARDWDDTGIVFQTVDRKHWDDARMVL